VQNAYFDGDSFHVLNKGKIFVFRLYFADCPETDNRFPERVAEQAKVFGVGVDGVLAAGHLARQFTAKALSKTFTVYTKWEDARGDSQQERFYAVVFFEDKNLAEELVRQGLARAYGMHADFPSEAGGRKFLAKLKRLQREAARARWGAFSSASGLPPNADQPSETAKDPMDAILIGY
jgi:endonuclease YncB( thermonuclease family)